MRAVIICLALLFLLVCCVGFYYLCNSYAVERAVDKLADSLSNLIMQAATGLFYILISVAIAVVAVGLGYGARAGAESVGRAIILAMAAPAIRGAIENKQTTRLPGGFTVENPQATPYQLETPIRTDHLPQLKMNQNPNDERRKS